ncbi:MAG: hypothetical protein ACKV19_25495 [Verrucomicrobiales bacterium]
MVHLHRFGIFALVAVTASLAPSAPSAPIIEATSQQTCGQSSHCLALNVEAWGAHGGPAARPSPRANVFLSRDSDEASADTTKKESPKAPLP